MPNRFFYLTGVDLNPFAGEPDPGMFGGELINVRINIKSIASIRRVRRWAEYGHSVYALFGHEVNDVGWGYTYSVGGLELFLTDYGHNIAAVTNRNEWDVEPNVERARIENEWAHRVCKEHGVPFAISSTLVQDWDGNITGLGGQDQWPGLLNLYEPGEVDGELVDLHLYSHGDGGNISRMLAQYRAMGYREPTIIGEFGTRIGEDIPVREMFDAVLNPMYLSAPGYLLGRQLGVVPLPPYQISSGYAPMADAAMLFCLQDFDDSSKRYGLLRTDGSRKDAFTEFVQVARERQDQKYYLGGTPVPDPEPAPAQQFKYAFAEYAETHPEVGSPDGQMWYEPHNDDGGETFDQVITYTSTGKMEYDSRTGKVRFFPAAS